MYIGDVLRRTWQITWRFKGLWILGILAGCSGGGGGGGSSSGSGGGVRYQFDGGRFPGPDYYFRNVDPNVLAFLTTALICLGILLVIGLFVLGILGQAGLISGFDLADEGHAVTLSNAFRRGLHYFWKILGAQVLLWILAVIVVIVLFGGGALLALGTLGVALICLVPLACLLVPALLLFGVYVMLTQVALVVEELDFSAAFSRSWQVMRENVGNVIVLGLILIVGGAVIGFLFSLLVLPAALPMLTALAIGGDQVVAGGIALSVLATLVLLPLLILVNGVIQTFATGAWTIAYRRMIGRTGAEAIA
jgi:hypothetical protein